EMISQQADGQESGDDPRRAKMSSEKVLQHRMSYAKDRRIVLVHGTQRTRMMLACAIDHTLEGDFPHDSSSSHTDDFGQAVFKISAQPGRTIRLTKYMAYHTSETATPDEVASRAEWTLDRAVHQGFGALLAEQEAYMDQFWRRSDVHVSNVKTQR